MPDIKASLEYLQRLKLYETEKPYYCLLRPQEGYDPNAKRLNNLEYESHESTILDMRHSGAVVSECGFQFIQHQSNALPLDSEEQSAKYITETELLLKKELGAVFTKCYEIRQRHNVPFERDRMDYLDPLLIEGPAKGAHNDITYISGPAIINRYLSDAEKGAYLTPGHRFRVVNTWRSLLPIAEDRPLALCDGRSVMPSDLVAADRIIPGRAGEVYYLSYSPEQKWYWLEYQTQTEPFLFVTYDTKSGSHARFCPHVSFDNIRKAPDAQPRHSVETRSIVVTRA